MRRPLHTVKGTESTEDGLKVGLWIKLNDMGYGP